MPSDWNADGDFAAVIDTLQSVTLCRRGCPESSALLLAWRFHEEIIDPSTSQGGVRRIDTTWQLPAGGDPPRPGDALIDENGLLATVRSVVRRQGSTRYECVTRLVEVHGTAAERFDLQRAEWQETGQGPEVTRWVTLRPAMLGHVCVRRRAGLDSEGGVDAGDFAITLLPAIEVRIGDRLAAHRGDIYRVTAVERPLSLGDPHLVVAKQETLANAA